MPKVLNLACFIWVVFHSIDATIYLKNAHLMKMSILTGFNWYNDYTHQVSLKSNKNLKNYFKFATFYLFIFVNNVNT